MRKKQLEDNIWKKIRIGVILKNLESFKNRVLQIVAFIHMKIYGKNFASSNRPQISYRSCLTTYFIYANLYIANYKLLRIT